LRTHAGAFERLLELYRFLGKRLGQLLDHVLAAVRCPVGRKDVNAGRSKLRSRDLGLETRDLVALLRIGHKVPDGIDDLVGELSLRRRGLRGVVGGKAQDSALDASLRFVPVPGLVEDEDRVDEALVALPGLQLG
jgi:hypothetical protein